MCPECGAKLEKRSGEVRCPKCGWHCNIEDVT